MRRGRRGRHVYFIQGSRGGLIKIGSSNDPPARLAEFQVNCPVRLRLLGVIWGGGIFREHYLHDEFKHLRQHGEWFRPTPELLAYIAASATDAADPPQPTEVAS
jgi:hypothetical protein